MHGLPKIVSQSARAQCCAWGIRQQTKLTTSCKRGTFCYKTGKYAIFGKATRNAMNVAHCKLQDTIPIPPVSIIALLICVFSNILKISVVHQAFKEACVDFFCRFLGLQMQLLSHKTYDASSQFSRQWLSFTLALKFCGFSFPIQNNLTNFFSFSPGNKVLMDQICL